MTGVVSNKKGVIVMSERNKEIVRMFENEFKNKANVGIVDELMTDGFTHHAPIPGVGLGREGLKQIGQFIFSQFSDIKVDIQHIFGEGGLVCTRVAAKGTRSSDGEPVSWTENHIYRVEGSQIAEWWGEGGPPMG
jgi:predicted SnoaL-like aldol condensation-catalyzing enzyme